MFVCAWKCFSSFCSWLVYFPPWFFWCSPYSEWAFTIYHPYLEQFYLFSHVGSQWAHVEYLCRAGLVLKRLNPACFPALPAQLSPNWSTQGIPYADFTEHTWFRKSTSNSSGRAGTQAGLCLLRIRPGQPWCRAATWSILLEQRFPTLCLCCSAYALLIQRIIRLCRSPAVAVIKGRCEMMRKW